MKTVPGDGAEVAAHVRDHQVADLEAGVRVRGVDVPGRGGGRGRGATAAGGGAGGGGGFVGGVHVEAPFRLPYGHPSDYSTNGWFV